MVEVGSRHRESSSFACDSQLAFIERDRSVTDHCHAAPPNRVTRAYLSDSSSSISEPRPRSAPPPLPGWQSRRCRRGRGLRMPPAAVSVGGARRANRSSASPMQKVSERVRATSPPLHPGSHPLTRSFHIGQGEVMSAFLRLQPHRAPERGGSPALEAGLPGRRGGPAARGARRRAHPYLGARTCGHRRSDGGGDGSFRIRDAPMCVPGLSGSAAHLLRVGGLRSLASGPHHVRRPPPAVPARSGAGRGSCAGSACGLL